MDWSTGTIFLLPSLLSVGCSNCSTSSSTAPAQIHVTKDPLILNDSDSGKVIALAPGQTLELRLVALPGQARFWRERKVPPALRLRAGFPRSGSGSGLPGAPQDDVFQYEVLDAQAGMLVLERVVSFDPSRPPDKVFNVMVQLATRP